MRKVTETVVSAFLAGTPKTVANTSTDGQCLFLHGNKIAQRVDGGIEIRTCGWNTPTTRERLNALPGVQVYSKGRVQHLNGTPWDGSPVVV